MSAVAGILNGHARRWNKQHRGKSREELYRKQEKFLLTPLPRSIWVVTKNGTTLQHRKPRQIHCHLHITKSDDVMRVSRPREKKRMMTHNRSFQGFFNFWLAPVSKNPPTQLDGDSLIIKTNKDTKFESELLKTYTDKAP